MTTQTFGNSEAFANIVKLNRDLYKKIYGVVINHEEQYGVAFSERAKVVQRDLARQSRNNVEQADLSQFCKLVDMSEATFKAYAVDMTRAWQAAFEQYPELPAMPPPERQNALSGGMGPDNPIIQMIAAMTGLDAETIFQGWLISIGGGEVPENASCEMLCDLVHGAEIAIMTGEHGLALWACGMLVFPPAILICMAAAAVSFGIQLDKANKKRRDCRKGC